MSAAEEMPETILQFGAGRFLRAFVDRFVQNANDQGAAVGRIVVVQSTPGARADLINRQPEGYHVLVRGFDEGELVERTEHVRSISRALIAQTQWPQVLEAARSAWLQYIVTNSTEAGFDVDPGDRLESSPPASMPGKLTRVLWERFQAGAAPVVLLPCELIEGNATKLLGIVTGMARDWNLPPDFTEWLSRECVWLNNLVDCIVTPVPADVSLPEWDRMPVSAEPFALWAIQRPVAPQSHLFPHAAIQVVDDLTPYYLRKVRILNGLHSAMSAKFRPAGFETVLQVVSDRQALRWLRALCFEEIVPTIAHRVDDAALFADQTFDRFRNPFLAHKLSDIALNHEAKIKVRLQPTRDEYARLFSRAPKKLCEVLGC